MGISRRQFLETAAVSGLAVGSALAAETDKKTGMPMRNLGRTGSRVSILAFGSGSRFLAYKEEEKALEALSRALDLGINYVDTAYGYGNGKSEEWVGKLMPARRKSLFLATKINVRNGDEALRILEGSMKRLQTDQVDLIHVHSLTDEADLAAIEAKDGVLNALYKLRDEKVTRLVGITSHTDPAVLKTALERHDFDCTQFALNAAQVGQAEDKTNAPGTFESLALPVANRKRMGIIAMKIFAQEKLNGKAPVEKLISYSLSLPVAAAVLGMPRLEYIEENIRIAKAFKPLPGNEMRELSDQLSSAHKASIDAFFHGHVDA
ncbi:MAG: aldo/keto reductase [Bryobacteraceae bacterium]